MKKNILYILIIIAFGAGSYFLISAAPKIHAKCLNKYPNTDAGSAEYLADFDKWTNDFFDKNPGAGLSGWNKARYQFWVDNSCTESIKAYNEAKAGKADSKTMQMIEDVIKEEVNNQNQ